jgi:hypothetical protein
LWLVIFGFFVIFFNFSFLTSPHFNSIDG